uniref:Uncharacterized protein n=1 Tax=Cannabis sativa TaxID=3483 RepID=A0A803PUL5_CANSA
MPNSTENTHLLSHLINSHPSHCFFPRGGLFVDPSYSLPPSLVSFITLKTRFDSNLDPSLDSVSVSCAYRGGHHRKVVRFEGLRGGESCGFFLSVSFLIKKSEEEYGRESTDDVLEQNENRNGVSEVEEAVVIYEHGRGRGVAKEDGRPRPATLRPPLLIGSRGGLRSSNRRTGLYDSS